MTATVAAAITTTLVIAGCGEDAGGSEDKTITVAISSSPSATALKALAPGFEKETGIKVEFVDIPYAQLAAKTLLAAKQPKGGYDVVQFDSPMLAPLAGGGALTDIGGRAEGSSSYDYADIPDQVKDYAKYRNTTYGLPLSTEPYVLWYNSDLFSKNNLKPPTTWDEYTANATKLKAAGAYGSDSGFGSEIGAYYWLETIYTFGGRLLKEGTCTPALDSPEVLAATKTYLSLKDTTPATAVNGGGNEMTTAFVQGDVGQMINATGYYSIMADPKQSKIPGKFAAAVPPLAGDQGRTLLFGWLIGLGKNSSSPENGWKFLEYAMGKANQSTFIEQGAPPPARKSLLTDAEAQKSLPYLKTLIDAAETGVHLPYISQMPEIITALSAQLSSAATGGQSAEQLVKAANDKVASILDGEDDCS
ncbi:ABC transporter substrate-binding protein [Micromonospora sp. NBS 11-29]|uniref:ABC transporter substrate-binding protein n=1 Tax=Micromonospora sp. NBS 11-29 TaxID=1960879 RepID=UPI001593C50B|nr:sugar ABC transporter substrate-binding protein [Micromonospora sp. NBS 11-29]